MGASRATSEATSTAQGSTDRPPTASRIYCLACKDVRNDMEHVTCTEESSPQCIEFWIHRIRYHVVQYNECCCSGAEARTCDGCIPISMQIIKFPLHVRALVETKWRRQAMFQFQCVVFRGPALRVRSVDAAKVIQNGGGQDQSMKQAKVDRAATTHRCAAS